MRIIVTGASSGIGKACSERLLNKGHECVLVARSEDKLRHLFKDYNESVRVIHADFQDIYTVKKIFDQTIDLYPFDALVHCAGIAPLRSITENTVDIVQETFSVNVFSFIELMRLFSENGVCKNGASVVAMSSVVAHRGSNRQSIYSATKAALEALSRCMSRELLERSIRVNTIVSTVVETEMLQKLREQSAGLDEKIRHHSPLGIVPVQKICDLVEFLLSESATQITGSSIPIDSGYLL